MKLIKKTFIVFFLLAVAGCERNWRDVGGKGDVITAPKYETSASVSAVPGNSQIAEVAPKGPGPDGAALYARHCAACHQATGQGIPGVFPPLDQSEYVVGDPNHLVAIVNYGLLGPITVNGAAYNSAMAALGTQMNDEELAAVASYVRGAWTNKASAIDKSVIAEVRAKWGQRGPLTVAELSGK